MKNERATKCPVCGALFLENMKKCPVCGYKKPLDLNKTLWIFIALLLPLTIIYTLGENAESSFVQKIKTQEEKTLQEAEISVPIRPMSELSYLTKDEIFAQRKKYVRKSLLFSDIKNYEPSLDVYKIESGLPWISAPEIAKNGVKDNPNIAKGVSRHSISINNPELLISFIVPNFSKARSKSRFSEADFFLPQKLLVNKEAKNIKAYFDIKTFYDKNLNLFASAMYPDETNARDFGYNWFYCDKRENIEFINAKNNISIKPHEVFGYYHKGFSCGVEGGCNNYSPYQEQLVFRIVQNEGYMRIRMWKKKPATKFQNPDMTYEMYFK